MILSEPSAAARHRLLRPRLRGDRRGGQRQRLGRRAAQRTETSGLINQDTIYVNDIVNDTPGQVLFRTEDDDTAGIIGGDGGTWEFRDSFERVTIVNHSDKPLSVGNIRAYNDVTGPDPAAPFIRFDALLTLMVTIDFDLRRVVRPTLVQIDSTSTADTADIQIAGTIDNPIGTTVVRSAGGDIVSTGDPRRDPAAARTACRASR